MQEDVGTELKCVTFTTLEGENVFAVYFPNSKETMLFAHLVSKHGLETFACEPKLLVSGMGVVYVDREAEITLRIRRLPQPFVVRGYVVDRYLPLDMLIGSEHAEELELELAHESQQNQRKPLATK